MTMKTTSQMPVPAEGEGRNSDRQIHDLHAQATSGPRPAHCGACGLWVPYPQTGKGWKWSTSPGLAGGSLCSQRARPNCGCTRIDNLPAEIISPIPAQSGAWGMYAP